MSLFNSCGCALSVEDLYKIDKTAMAEILAVGSGDDGISVGDKLPEAAKVTANVVSDLQLELVKVNDGLEGEEEEGLTLELEEILKTCSETQANHEKEVESRDKKADRGKSIYGMLIGLMISL